MNGFTSGLAPQIHSLLELKHAMGLSYATAEQNLRAFDAMCSHDFPAQTSLTRDMAMAWAAARPGEHINTQILRISPVRQLAKHSNGLGIDAYVIPAGIPGRQIPYRPHIFTHQQLRALFNAADAIQRSPSGGQRHLVIPVFFRVIYCLGLRPGEARRLHRHDVDLVRGTIRIRETKGHKDRIVYMSTDLHDYCRSYDTTMATYQPNRVAFFPNQKGHAYSATTIIKWFHRLLNAAEPKIVAHPASPPRPYDLRHAHVIENINRWAHAGRDPEALLPLLSLHLGHTDPDDTWYYFHLAADFHPDLRRQANTHIESILPEASHEIR